MKKFFSLLFLLAAVCSYSQNPYTVTTKYLTGDCLKPDTVISTTVVTGKSGYFSSKVTQTAVSSLLKKLYQAPVVIPENHAPTITISGLSTITQPVTTVTLTATVQDIDNNLSGILWEKVSGGPATIASPTGNPCLFQGLSPGQYLFRATATDKGGLQAIAQFAVTVIGVSTTPPTNPDPPPVTSGTPKFYQGFETSIGADDVTFNHNIQQADGLNLITLTSEQKSAGSKSIKVTLSKTDAAKKARAELTMIGTDDLKEGSERVFEFDRMCPDTKGDYMYTFFQFHHNADNYTPPFMVGQEQGRWLIATVPTYGGSDVYNRNLPAITPGKWYHIKVHIIFSSVQGTALAEVSVDGNMIYSSRVPTLFANMSSYAKIGIYNWGYSLSQNASITEYIDEFKCYVVKP